MKYAISQISGKQQVVKPGHWYDIDFIKNTKTGDFLLLTRILLLKNNNKIQLGYPFLSLSKIPAKIIQEVKSKKIMVLKTKPKKHYTRKKGHKQKYTRIQINYFQ